MREEPSNKYDVIVVGGGISGLAAAFHLEQAGRRVALFEGRNFIGGRIATDEYQGFLLDHGFQILLPAYPEAMKIFRYEELQLRYFRRGARVYLENGWRILPDPLDDPWGSVKAAFAPFGTFRDKIQLAGLTMKAARGALKGDPHRSTGEYLKAAGLSDLVLNQFLTPFFRGVFLEEELSRASDEFAFYLSMFAKGGGALPANGMRALPNSLAKRLKEGTIRTGSWVRSVRTNSELSNSIVLESGEEHFGDHIILATDEEAAKKLLSFPPQSSDLPPKKARGTLTLYFQGPRAELSLPPYLHLVPNSPFGITNIAPLSAVASEYAPPHLSLIGVSINDTSGIKKGEEELAQIATKVESELCSLFGPSFKSAEYLKGFSIPLALPSGNGEELRKLLPPGVLLAGDIAIQGSINGALKAGRLAAETLNRQ